MDGGGWRIGALAELTGLTVRALHHYDHLGLVRPSQRTAGGHRVYGEDDVARLYQVLALRSLGLPLAGIAEVLFGAQDVAEVLEQHLRHVQQELTAMKALHSRLVTAVEAARNAAGPSASDLLVLIDEVRRVDEITKRYFDADQLSVLAERRERLGEDRIAEVQARWPVLIAQVQAAVDAGMPPADPAAAELAAEWMSLLESFHGGDEGIRDSLYRMQAENGERIRAEAGGPTAELIAFVTAANAARQG